MNISIMLRRTAYALTLVACMHFGAPAVASDMGDLAADQVDINSFIDFMDNWLYTHVGDNRGPSGPDHDPCRDNIRTLFESYGLSVEFQPFSYSGGTYENVIATQVGTVYPDQEFIIGAHYDSVSNPGADDNASGVALVLECARILSQYDSDYTIRYIAFDMEEVGLVGSNHYVDAHFGDDILGMISADMVAYDTGTNRCNVYGRTASNPIKNALAAAVSEYGNGLIPDIGGDTPYSDHAPFEAEGFQACLLIEGEVWDNPYYHQQEDNFENPDNLNFDYAEKMVRSVVGYLVDNAGVQVDVDALGFEYPEGLPEYATPAGTTRVRVDVVGIGDAVPMPGTGMVHYNAGSGWMSEAMDVVSDNVYEAVLPGAPCGQEVQYYFSAESMGGEMFTHPRSAPTSYHAAISAWGRAVVFEELMDSDPGWTTEGLWAFGQPTGGGGDHGNPDPTSGFTGPNVYGYNLGGDYENQLPERHLTTPAIDCTGVYNLELTFQRWLGVEQPSYDHAYVRISTNGTNWTELWTNTSEVTDGSWTEITYDISAYADDEPTVYLRWTMGTTDWSWRYCGWNIDDVSISALQCEAPFLLGDLNCDGVVNNFDIDAFVLALTDAAAYEALYPDCDLAAGDVNGDGAINNFDIDPFVALLTGG